MKNFNGMTVLITGASSGIGEGCAKALAKKGADIIICARRLERLKTIKDEITKASNVKVLPLYLDVRNYAEVKNAIDSLPDEWKPIDVLINNAGLSLGADKIQDAKIENFDTMIDTNIKGVYNLTHVLLPEMIKRNRGHIINIGSIAGSEIYQAGSIYCSSKAAVRAFTRATRLDAFGSDVRVTLIEPGLVTSEFQYVKHYGDKEKAKEIYEGIEPLTPEDIADVVIYSISCPPHVNIDEIVVKPVHQASTGLFDRSRLSSK